MNLEHVLLEKSNRIGTVTLNRPEKLNTFAGRMREEILEALQACFSDPEIHVVVITGAGKAFCAGGDINEHAEGRSRAGSEVVTTERNVMAQIVLSIHTAEKPVIAAVNGVAAGGGCNLALSCDIRIASEKAQFVQSFVRIGAYPDWGGVYFLPRLVGYAKAAELIFTSEKLSGEDAKSIGMVNHLVAHEELMPFTYRLAERIAKNAPLPIAFAKRGLQRSNETDLIHALDYEAYVLKILQNSEDLHEGFRAFLERRPPVFKGR
jgi:enoyl-CoA hydratase/carnithine racemase